jgi:hypothetical protein
MTAATVRAQQIPAEVLYWEHVNSRRAGHQTTIGEIKGLLHFWRYVGDLLGVQPDDYPETFRDSTIQLTFASMVKRAYSAGRERRNRWYANDTGGSGAKFIPVEEFRR